MAVIQKQLKSGMSIKTNITVFTDVGVKDVDDELLLSYLYRTHSIEDSMGPVMLDIIFMGSDGVSPQKAQEQWKKYETHLLTKFSHGTDEGYLQIQAPYVLKGIRYHTINEFKNILVDTQYALQISPMNGYDGSNLTVHEKYVFAGDYITPDGARPSFNRVGAEEILNRFHEEGKLVDISSAHMAKMRFNPELVAKFDGPFLESIVFTAFLLAFARMSPEHSANKFAEGLINPNVGRGANYNSVMKMRDIFNIDISKLIYSDGGASSKYFTELSTKGVFGPSGSSPSRDESEKYLYEMNMVLRGISDKACESLSIDKVDIWSLKPWKDNLFSAEVFVSDFDINTIPEVLKPSWEFFKMNAEKLYESFNPVYDLFAGYVLVGLIKGEDRKSHTREEFLKNILSEF